MATLHTARTKTRGTKAALVGLGGLAVAAMTASMLLLQGAPAMAPRAPRLLPR